MSSLPAKPHDRTFQRRLVTVRKVTGVRTIKRSRADLVTVDHSWTVVAQKEEYTIGQIVVYFEVDSFIPSSDPRMWEYSPWFIEFDGQKGYHVRSEVTYGELSQGLIFPIEAFNNIEAVLIEKQRSHDLAEAFRILREMSFESDLGVKKWEVLEDTNEIVLGKAPAFFPRPGAPRAQNLPRLFDHRGLQIDYQITEKLDGLSMTVYCVNKNSVWCRALPQLSPESKQETATHRVGIANQKYDIAEREEDLYWQTAKQASLLDKISKIGGNVAVQGELVGHTIKRNSIGFGPGEHRFLIFDIFDIDKQRHRSTSEVEALCRKLSLPHVPIIAHCKLGEFATSLAELLEKAEGTGMLGKMREGLVFKTKSSTAAFKVIANSWLLEYGE
ncbi:putative rna drb0094 family protein [Phaeoacremonium minimum UCRPA7]|uniref:Putative rna drb0094 family protein n=1 Tax=Phaeoacremonium minimum (strain UCR-PA7) TaxID=1286976 RepID=R8BCV0_PHAM7|nr:putative rna drb0094 family protein [Phaeoacremonium minimum UCRPA7]EON97121.1 putative rna drb0094 family protein [Phaeoacremonium minimum UCRPA7]